MGSGGLYRWGSLGVSGKAGGGGGFIDLVEEEIKMDVIIKSDRYITLIYCNVYMYMIYSYTYRYIIVSNNMYKAERFSDSVRLIRDLSSTILTSDSELILKTYMVTPTTTGGPEIEGYVDWVGQIGPRD